MKVFLGGTCSGYKWRDDLIPLLNCDYCPCRISKTPDTKCKCKEFRDMIERGETGMCHCGLFIAEDDSK